MQDHQLETSERSGYFYACVRAADLNYEVLGPILVEVNRGLKHSRTGCLMLELGISDMSHDPDIFVMMNELISLMPGVKIVLINSNAGQKEAMEFAVAIGRQETEELSYFTDRVTGEKWLTSSDWLETYMQPTPLNPSPSEVQEAADHKRLLAKDKSLYLDRMRSSMEHNTEAFTKWEAEKRAAEKVLHDLAKPKVPEKVSAASQNDLLEL